jgi:hypothetical protein
VADDLILNPAISADTYAQVLKLDANSSFIPELLSIPQPSEYWSHNRNGLLFDAFRTEGMEVRGEVPDAAEAAERLRRHGVFGSSFTFAQVYGAPAPAEGVRARLRHLRGGKSIRRTGPTHGPRARCRQNRHRARPRLAG